VYGVEPATGLGGLMAQAPPNPYGARSAGIRSPGADRIGAPTIGSVSGLPYNLSPMTPSGYPPQVSSSGMQIERPANQQVGGWREILDFHNSPAPWILIAILFIYAWTHLSYRARGTAELGIARR
jgi:hypothetical protein